MFVPLFALGYNINKRPMNSKLLNWMENLNEIIVYICGYFILLYTQWICDPEKRYEYGWFYIYIQVVVVSINFSLIFFEMGLAMRKEYRRYVWLKKWNQHFKSIFVANVLKMQAKERK